MSLQVWLPLNGDLKNQGLANIPPLSLSSLTFDNNGKIGKCLKIPKITTNNIVIPELQGVKKFSFSCWLYLDTNLTNSSYTRIFSLGHTSDGETGYIRIETIPTNGEFQIIYNKSASHGGGGYATVTYYGITGGSTASAKNKWVHVTVTNDGTNVRTYFNGELQGTWAVNTIYDAGSLNGNFYLGGSYVNLNDVRIYDHALSAKEVKEISKALVLHYRLSGGGQSNLITGNFSCTSTKTEYKSSGNVGCVVTAADLLANRGKTLTLSYDVYSMGNYTQNTAGNWQADRFGVHGSVKYTPAGSTTSTQAYPLADLLTRGKSGHVSATWTIPTNVTSFDSDLTFSVQTNGRDGYAYPASTNNETWYLRNVKLEWGDKSTAWCPNVTDPLYTDMGYNIEWDCGTANSFDGTKAGNITNDVDTPRYSSSYQFNPQSSITTDSGFPVGSNTVFTFNIWLKVPSGKTMTQYGDYFAIKGSNLRVETASTNGLSLYWFNYPINTSAGMQIANIQADAWYMHTLVCDGTKFYIYLNGKLTSTIPLTGTAFTTNGGLVLGDPSTATMYSNMSDCRVYATALSADDIAELYHTAAIVDNQNNMYAYEYVEEEVHA